MMTREQAIAALIEKDVAKWGESERPAALRANQDLTLGLALNKLAHYDIANIDAALAADAKKMMTQSDKRVLREAK